MDKLNELYQRKGEATTQIEIWQQILKATNDEIVKELNKPKIEEPKQENV
jgi:hypothetical protein